MAQTLPRSQRASSSLALWAERHHRLVAFAVSVAGVDVDTARDLAQDVLLSALRSFPGGEAPVAWIYAVARNRLTDWFRAEGRRRARQAPSCNEESLAGETVDPAEALDRRDMRRRLGRYLDALPPREREVAFLRFFEGMRHREIAAATGMPTGTVKFLVHRIREGARSALEGPDA